MIIDNYFKSTFVPAACALAALFMLNTACGDDDPKPNPENPAPKLTYAKQTITYDDLTAIVGSNDRKAGAALILGGVKGEKGGYTIKTIKNVKSNPDGIASVGTADGAFFIQLKGIATVTFDLTLKHASKAAVSIKDCKMVIDKGKAVALTFNKLAKVYIRGGRFTTAEILGKITGATSGYQLKSIGTLNPAGVATVSGTAPNLQLDFVADKTGQFTAKLVLAHPTKADATITGASFEITKVPVNLSLNQSSISVAFGSSVTKPVLSGQNTALGAGAITYDSSDTNVASVAGNGDLTIKGIGTTTITITQAATDTHAKGTVSYSLTVNRAGAVSLGFANLSKVYSRGGKFTTAEILGKITGAKGGYRLKSISALNPAGTATVSGTAPNLQLDFAKAGRFTAKLVLAHPTKADATINGAAFEITKVAVNLSLDKSRVTVALGNSVTKPVLSGHNTASGAGAIAYTSSDTSVATVASNGDLTLKGLGTTTITITQAATDTHLQGTVSYNLKVISKDAKILQWRFGSEVATISGTDIKITLPFGTDVKTLTASATLSTNAAINPNPAQSRDYTNPVDFTVTAEDGTKQQYTVTVTVAKNDQAKILQWKFGDKTATISGTDIKITLPFGTDVKTLTASANLSAKATINPDPTQSRDYTNPVDFTVTAEDSTTKQKYKVTVTLANPLLVKWTGGWRDDDAYNATIDQKTGKITLDVNSADFDTKVTLASGATISPDPQTIDDWTTEKSFTVTKGGVSKTYKITVTVGGKKIIKVTDANIKATINSEIAKNGDTADYNYIDVSAVTNMNKLFDNRQSFNGDISKWDVAKVNTMRSMFRSAYAFNQDIGKWNVAEVTDTYEILSGARAFNQDISKWNVAKVTNMVYMFYDARVFNQDIGEWNVANVTNMSFMFTYTEAFNQDISKWNVANVTDMSFMFRSAKAFNQDLSTWSAKANKVTACSSFSVNASRWTKAKPTFKNCK